VTALALALAALTVAPSVAGAGTAREPAPVDPFADLLVKTATTDLRYPWDAMPPVVSGVLASRSAARVEALRVLEQAQQEAAAAAYAEALRAAASRTGSGGGGGGGPRATSGGRCNGDFDCFKPCTLDIESDGNYGAISPGGTYRGAWQFDQPTWNGAVARAGYPEWSGRDPAAAPPHVQDAAARQLYSERGNQPWGGRC
jgi:hypothetical protein